MFGREFRLLAAQLALRASDRHALAGAHPQQVDLEFSEGSQDVEEHLPHRVGRVLDRAEICIDEHIRTRRPRSGSRPGPLRSSRSGLVELLVIDEAERLSSTALEYVRDQFDRTGIGVVLIGMPGIEKRVARYPQLYSRVGFAHHYRPLQGDELSFVLTRHWRQLGLTLDDADFTDSQAIAAIARITGGNFRLLHRLFVQIGIWPLFRNGLDPVTAESLAEEDACGAGKDSASVHLSFDHLEPVDIAFDDAGVPVHGEAVEDGLLVAFDAVGEGVQVGLVVGVDGGEPVVEAVAVQAGEDLGELGDVAGARVRVRAVLPGPGEFLLFLVVVVVRVGEDPAGQVAGLGGPGTAAGRVSRKDGT